MADNKIKYLNVLDREFEHVELFIKQVDYWRTHLDVFIEEYLGIKLKSTQRPIARAIGNGEEISVVKSRGYGKTWLVAVCACALAILYPGSPIRVISQSLNQAALILGKIETELLPYYPALRNEVRYQNKNQALGKSSGRVTCNFHNGSFITTNSLKTITGERTKILIVDEAPKINDDMYKKNARPTLNYKRVITHKSGVQDYPSKVIKMTSASYKNTQFFKDFLTTLKGMAKGSMGMYAFALDWKSALRVGIGTSEWYKKEQDLMPLFLYQMEYGSVFMGETDGSYFPYDITEPCRNLIDVELSQPKKSNSKYVITLDIALSSADGADNAVLEVGKIIENADGSCKRRIVYMRSFKGETMTSLAQETRRLYLKFPNTIKIVFDRAGLGRSYWEHLNTPWVDSETGIEHPPLILDDDMESLASIPDAVPILRGFIADNASNNKMAQSLRLALEKKKLEIPIGHRDLRNVSSDEDDDIRYTRYEVEFVKSMMEKHDIEFEAIFLEADALQIELGNVKRVVTSANNIVYQVKQGQHKDRYSATGMMNMFVDEFEAKNIKEKRREMSAEDIGFAVNIRGTGGVENRFTRQNKRGF